MVSVIIPALNEESCLGETLRAVWALEGAKEVIVADGGSTDRTVAVAETLGARVVAAPRGRGSQMHAGAAIATGEILWFLHADTVPPREALSLLEGALQRPGVGGGNFGLVFDGLSRAARWMTTIYPFLQILNLCYGDSGFFLSRDTYVRVGGFRALPLFEDLDLLRRLRRRGKFVHLSCPIVTSSRRFEKRNFASMWVQWTAMQVLYWCGADPNWLARWYRHVRRIS